MLQDYRMFTFTTKALDACMLTRGPCTPLKARKFRPGQLARRWAGIALRYCAARLIHTAGHETIGGNVLMFQPYSRQEV